MDVTADQFPESYKEMVLRVRCRVSSTVICGNMQVDLATGNFVTYLTWCEQKLNLGVER
jgi:hypothetical protein